MTIERVPLPDTEIADGVRMLLLDLMFTSFTEAERLSDVEFHVPPYLATEASLARLARLPTVPIVQALTAGVDWITASVPAGVILGDARGVHDASSSELALAGILAMARCIPAFVRAQDRAVWNHTRVGGLAGSRAGLLGHGAIGKAIACRLEPFDVQVIGVTLSGRDNTVPMAEVDHVLSDCEILIITLPLTPSTRGVVDAAMLSRLPDGALVVSVGRGPTADDEALRAAARRRRVVGLPNVVVMPHVGGHSDLFPGSASALLASQIQRYLSDAALEHTVTGAY